MTESPVGPAPVILTPDRRVRVFVSSTLTELAAERVAARRAIAQLHLTPVMFEEGARPHPPRALYRSYLAQSDVFVGIYGQSYGWVAPTEDVSGLEDEYLQSGVKPKLLYVKSVTERAPRLGELLARLQADDVASYKHFDTPEALAELLADDLAVLLTERFAASAVPGAAEKVEQPSTIPTPPTEIIGRDQEVTRLVSLLGEESVHLVTLLGPGGIGKTRLAVEVARRLDGTTVFDAVWFVDLAPLTDAADCMQAIAATLGVRAAGREVALDLVIDRLHDGRTLLVLDNVEHLLAAAPEIGRLLAGCPGLTVLVTSRIVLRLRGEREVTLLPLGMPSADTAVDPETVEQSAAVQLLLARGRDVRPAFSVTEANAEAMADLARRLDGIPLALELVAAQFRLLTPKAVVARLSEQLSRPLDLTAGPVDLPDRHRTLRATIDWSHSLLSEAEKTLLARVSVMPAAWTLSVAEAVGAVDDDLDVVSTLTSLVAQSLVRADYTELEEPTFRLLETIRSYSGERLVERGELDDTMARLAKQLLAFVAEVSPALEGTSEIAAEARIDRRIGDLRVVTAWALGRDDAETVVRLGAPLFSYWWSHGLLPYTYALAERTAALASAEQLTPEAATLLLWARGIALVAIGHTDQAEPLLRQLEAATRDAGDRLHAHALYGLGLALIHDRVGEAAAQLDQAAVEFRTLGEDWGLAITLSTRGGLALVAGDAAAATAMHLEALAAAERVENDYLRAQVLDMLGLDAAAVGASALARERHASAATLHTRLFDQEGSAYNLIGLAGLALGEGRPDVAARLLAAAHRAWDAVGVAVWPWMQASVDALEQSLRSTLDPADLARATADGSQMRIPEAFRYATNAVSAQDEPN